MSMFHIGQQVVCISDEGVDGGRPFPCRGCVYTISEVFYCYADRLTLQFEEIRWEGDGLFYPGFKPDRFRPVKKTNIEIFQRLLAPTPELVS